LADVGRQPPRYATVPRVLAEAVGSRGYRMLGSAAPAQHVQDERRKGKRPSVLWLRSSSPGQRYVRLVERRAQLGPVSRGSIPAPEALARHRRPRVAWPTDMQRTQGAD
jgi:hypothetical protein